MHSLSRPFHHPDSAQNAVASDPGRVFLRKCIRALFLTLLRVRCRIDQQTVGLLNTRPCIVIANHGSYIDGLLLAMTSPAPMTFAADPAYAVRHPVTSKALQWLSWLGFGKVVPVDSQSPYGARTLLMAWQRGEHIMIFPEGGVRRGASPLPAWPGAQWLIEKTDAPVVLVLVDGAEKSCIFSHGQRFLPKIRVTYWQITTPLILTPTHMDTQEEALLKLARQSAYDAVKAALLSAYRSNPKMERATALEIARKELISVISSQRTIDTLSSMAVDSARRLTGLPEPEGRSLRGVSHKHCEVLQRSDGYGYNLVA
jgi:1-acyl-sn-glycerol-3-phosphate acyltransferase